MTFRKNNYILKSFENDYKAEFPHAVFDKDSKGCFTNKETIMAFRAYERAFNFAHTLAREEITEVNGSKATSKVFVIARSNEQGNFEFSKRLFQHHTFRAASLDAETRRDSHGKSYHVFACIASFSHKHMKDPTKCKITNTVPLDITSEEPSVTS